VPGRFNPDDYETVEQRLKRFWSDHPGGAIITEIVNVTPDHKSVIVRAEAWFDRNGDKRPAGVGIAQESAGGQGANSTSWTENCDTSAVGRALANCGYSGDRRPSREEMQKANRGQYADEEPRRFPPPQRQAYGR